MEITLEKIELVKDRTGVTYAEAKKALEEADGSVVDAIIAIEETINAVNKGRAFGEKVEALFASLKNLVKKGNVAKIQVKREGDTVLNIPVNVGIVGVCIAPLASVVAMVAAFGFKCVIEVVKTDGTIIDVSDAVSEKVAAAAEFGSDKFEDLKDKSREFYDKAKESDLAGKAKDAAADIKEKAEDLAEDIKEKVKRDSGDDEPEAWEADEDEAVEDAEIVEEAAETAEEEVVEEAAEDAEKKEETDKE